MALYTPRQFTAPADADVLDLLREHPFAALITAVAGEPLITHLPLLWEAGDGAHGVLLGHMARANPHWQAFAEGYTLAIFSGPHAYISPSWYENPADNVPTWNYSTVHAHGRPELIDGRDEKLALIDRSTAAFEAGHERPWTRVLDGERLDTMLRSIVAFRIPIERVDAKFKLNQNRTAGDRAKVIKHLRSLAHPDLHAMAQWMALHERG